MTYANSILQCNFQTNIFQTFWWGTFAILPFSFSVAMIIFTNAL